MALFLFLLILVAGGFSLSLRRVWGRRASLVAFQPVFMFSVLRGLAGFWAASRWEFFYGRELHWERMPFVIHSSQSGQRYCRKRL